MDPVYPEIRSRYIEEDKSFTELIFIHGQCNIILAAADITISDAITFIGFDDFSPKPITSVHYYMIAWMLMLANTLLWGGRRDNTEGSRNRTSVSLILPSHVRGTPTRLRDESGLSTSAPNTPPPALGLAYLSRR